MRVFVAADHRGFELKDKLIDYLHEKDLRVEDLGPYELDPEDDYNDFAEKVSQAVLQDPDNSLGILICSSGIGMTIVANRFKGIRCGLALNREQVEEGRMKDHINVLALPSGHLDIEDVKEMVNAFLETHPSSEEKYLRRIKKTDRENKTEKQAPNLMKDL